MIEGGESFPSGHHPSEIINNTTETTPVVTPINRGGPLRRRLIGGTMAAATVISALGMFGINRGMDSEQSDKKPLAISQITDIRTPLLVSSSTESPPPVESPEIKRIKEQIKNKVSTSDNAEVRVEAPYDFSDVDIYNDSWAIAQITGTNIDNANIVVKKEKNGQWKIVEGPFTFSDDELLRAKGVPEDVIEASGKF